jgi:hypothetical protein
MKWIGIEDDLCEQIARGREIMTLLADHKVPTDNVTCEALRIVATALMDQLIEQD